MPPNLLHALEAYARLHRLRPVGDVLTGVRVLPWWVR